MQLINSTVIRELSTIYFFPAAYIRGPISGGGGLYPDAYKRGACILGAYIRGAYIPGGLYPGTYIPGACIRGLVTGAYSRWTFIRGPISGGFSREANIRGLITGGLYPRDFYPGDLYSTLTIFKDSTCFTLGAGARFCCK